MARGGVSGRGKAARAAAAALALCGLAPAAGWSQNARSGCVGGEGKAIYGADDRCNYYESGAREQAASESVVALFEKSALFSLDSGKTWSGRFRRSNLCSPEQASRLRKPAERFYSEPASAFCTGFKIGPDLIATAGHCIASAEQCGKTAIVFKYRMPAAGADPLQAFPAGDVFFCKEIVAERVDEATREDVRIVRVDRPMEGHPEVALNTGARPPVGTDLVVIGHPIGLPVKIARNAKVRALRDIHFIANLDAFVGNSGAPVFNAGALAAGRLLVEGMLVRGEEDFDVERPCKISKRCAAGACRGEDVLYSSRLAPLLPGR